MPRADSIEDILDDELSGVREAMTALENTVAQDDHLEGWEDAIWATSNLDTALDQLYEKVREQLRIADEEAEES